MAWREIECSLGHIFLSESDLNPKNNTYMVNSASCEWESKGIVYTGYTFGCQDREQDYNFTYIFTFLLKAGRSDLNPSLTCQVLVDTVAHTHCTLCYLALPYFLRLLFYMNITNHHTKQMDDFSHTVTHRGSYQKHIAPTYLLYTSSVLAATGWFLLSLWQLFNFETTGHKLWMLSFHNIL